jgi:hypothetical protein
MLLGLLLTTAAFFAWRKTALTRPLLVALGTTLAGVGVSAFVALVATLIRPGDFWRAYPLVTYLAVYAVVVATMSAIWARWGGGIARTRMRAAAWLLILLIGTALSMAMPGAIPFFLLGPALGIAAVVLERRSPQTATVVAVVATTVQFLMFAQLLALIEMLLIDGPLWAVTPLAALAVLPALVELGDARLRVTVSLIAVAAIGFWAAALLLPRSSAERPASFSIDYFRDASQNTASWGIAAKQAPLPRAYGRDWRREVLPYSGRARWVANAPLLATPVPSARLVGSEAAGAGRRVRIALSPGGGDAVTIRFAKGTMLLAVGLPGTPERIPLSGEPEKPLIRCTGRSCEGFIIEAMLADRRPLDAEVLSYRFSLPPEGARLAAARPKNAIPQYAPDSTITMTRVRL